MRALFYALTLLLVTGLLQACSDSNNNLSQLAELLGPDPISVATPNAERCEILDSDNCLFPWPSNALTVEDAGTDTGRLVNLNSESLPSNRDGVAVDPAEWNRNDGFSPSQVAVLQVPGIDLARTGVPSITDLEESQDMDSPILVINAATGEPHLIFAELDVNTSDPAEQTFLIRPLAQYERGGRYIVAMRRLLDAGVDGIFTNYPDRLRNLLDPGAVPVGRRGPAGSATSESKPV